ncbi:MAG: hypothetical protein V1778_02410 [bacterium]
MPNLTIYGVPSLHFETVLRVVEQAMQSIGLADAAVVTFVHSTVKSCDGKRRPMPYIRLSTTGDREEVESIIGALKKVGVGMNGLDLEWIQLGGFIEAKDMA